MPGLHRAAPAAAGDRARRACRFLEGLRLDLVGIGKAGALARHGAHAHALLDAGAALLDDAVLQGPGLLLRHLKIQVRGVHLGPEHQVEGLAEAAGVQSGGLEQAALRQLHRLGRESALRR